jgi:hypothetical protein
MDFRRVRAADWLAALVGAVLLVDLFLPWYGAAGLTVDAWEAFSYVDLLIALACLAAIALPIVTAASPAAAGQRLMASFVFWVALAAAIFAVIRLINVPGVDTIIAGGGADITRKAGAFIGVVAALGLLFFAWRAKRDPTFAGPLRTHPTVETLPPPTAEDARRDA